MAIEYRNLRIDERGLVQQLFRSYYDPNVYCTEDRYLDWLHRDNLHRLEYAEPNEFNIMAAVDGDRLLACINYLPGEVHVGPQRYRAVFTTESLSLPEAAGVYGLLARRLINRFDHCLMMGATTQLRDLYVQKMNATYCHEMPRVVLFGDMAKLVPLLHRGPTPPSPAAVECMAGWAADAERLAADHRWASIGSDQPLRDAYWQDMLGSGDACSLRDPSWLEWRYRRHPHLHYDVIAVDADQSAGIAVVRRQSLAGTDAMAVRVLEFLPTVGGELALAGAIARYAADSGHAFLDFFCAHDARLAKLPEAFVRPSAHLPHNVPYLLAPPEWRARRSINLLSMVSRRSRKTAPVLLPGAIYTTKGDAAQDVAVNPEYRSAHVRTA